jgi:L-aminopeptidase/D-esterase-like protein
VSQLTVAGVPVGREIPGTVYGEDTGSIIIAVATDAPLLPHQLKRVARRATMGLARTGSTSGNGSGDIFIAFSTANPKAWTAESPVPVKMLPNEEMNGLFEATVQSVEEAIVNAMVAAETMTGVDGHRADRLPHDRLRAALQKYGRLAP